mmetsp:Transcript_31723/g.64100  ORF Transcript_31723/g.64100 Transcript_31723/m.64100 type:complete len:264 (+) Transcript_31723:148-939(+)
MRLTTTLCMLALSTSPHDVSAFQTSQQYTITQQPQSSTTTTLYAGRKGNRGTPKAISENTSRRPTRSQVHDVLEGITSEPSFPHSVDPTDLPPGHISADPLVPLVHTIVHAADMRKATDIVALRVTQCTSLTNFIIVISGTSRPQNQAIANSIKSDVEELYDGKRCLGKGIPEGSADSGWILLDYGEVMVHVMTPKSRLFYDMEGQWRERGGKELDLGDVILDEFGGTSVGVGVGGESSEGSEEERSMRERLDVEKEEDPFWS